VRSGRLEFGLGRPDLTQVYILSANAADHVVMQFTTGDFGVASFAADNFHTNPHRQKGAGG
jgi:hypothetical protein